MAFNELVNKIENFTDDSEWEKIACDVLSKFYRGIKPQSPDGGADGGKDALWEDSSNSIGVHITLRKDYENKFNKDLTKSIGKDYSKIVFFSNRNINGIKKDELRHRCKKILGIDVEIWDQQAIRLEIENNRPELLSKFGLDDMRLKIENADLISTIYKTDPKEKLKILEKYMNKNLSEGDKVSVTYNNGKPEIKTNLLTLKEIKFSTTFKVKEEKLEGFSNIDDYIKNKLSRGEDVVFTEEEIEKFELKEPDESTAELESGKNIFEMLKEKKLKTIKISPQPISEPLILDIEVYNSSIKYENLEFARIKHEKDFSVARTFGSEFIMIMKVDKYHEKTKKYNITITLDRTSKDLSKEIKFNEFIRDLKKNKILIFRDSKTKNIIDRSRIDDIDVDSNWLDILNKIRKVEQFFGLKFKIPDSLTIDELNKLDIIYNAISHNKHTLSFENIRLKIDKEFVKKIIDIQKQSGFLDKFTIVDPDLLIEFLGHSIKLGKCSSVFPKIEIIDHLEELEKEIKKSDMIEVNFKNVSEDRYDVIFYLDILSTN